MFFFFLTKPKKEKTKQTKENGIKKEQKETGKKITPNKGKQDLHILYLSLCYQKKMYIKKIIIIIIQKEKNLRKLRQKGSDKNGEKM